MASLCLDVAVDEGTELNLLLADFLAVSGGFSMKLVSVVRKVASVSRSGGLDCCGKGEFDR